MRAICSSTSAPLSPPLAPHSRCEEQRRGSVLRRRMANSGDGRGRRERQSGSGGRDIGGSGFGGRGRQNLLEDDALAPLSIQGCRRRPLSPLDPVPLLVSEAARACSERGRVRRSQIREMVAAVLTVTRASPSPSSPRCRRYWCPTSYSSVNVVEYLILCKQLQEEEAAEQDGTSTTMGNKGTFVRFTAPEMKPDIVTFSAMLAGIEYMEQVGAPSPGRSPNESKRKE
ncbi:unnamed protein product [Urochloa humidicola]